MVNENGSVRRPVFLYRHNAVKTLYFSGRTQCVRTDTCYLTPNIIGTLTNLLIY